MQLRVFDVPVDGGELRVLQWGTGRRVVVAVHGITASAMTWQAVARQMPAAVSYTHLTLPTTERV